MNKIFVISSTEDEVMLKSFIKNILVGEFGINAEDVFFVTKDTMQFDENWKENSIRKIDISEIVLLFRTENYQESFIEGVARAKGKSIIEFNMPSKGKTKNKEFVLRVEERLDSLRDDIIYKAQIDANNLKTSRWTVNKNCFIDNIKNKESKYDKIKNFLRNLFYKGVEEIIFNYVKASI